MSARNARDLAYHTVRSRIITMELKPGDPLNDRELAEELGISRTPMREALILLNNAHMVAIKPQSGTHVAPIDLHLMELEQFSRYTLEKEILTRMCGRLTPEQETGYRQLIEAYRGCPVLACRDSVRVRLRGVLLCAGAASHRHGRPPGGGPGGGAGALLPDAPADS